jgi:ABC-2 type transport system permease protein
VAEQATAYRVLIGSRLRSQTAYRGSFAMDLVAGVGVTAISFAEIAVIYSNVDLLGGLNFAGTVTVFALAHVCFTLADMMIGHLGNLPTYVRTGSLDAFMLRPLSILGQLATSDLSLRRLGRTGSGLILLAWALGGDRVHWSPAKVVLLVLAIASGTAIFAALFVCGGAVQFWLVEGGEFAAAFTYGGHYAANYPASIYALPLRLFFTFAVPSAFVAYLPVLVLLDQPGPIGLPAALGWCGPLMAAASWLVASMLWRAGIRHYTGAGS